MHLTYRHRLFVGRDESVIIRYTPSILAFLTLVQAVTNVAAFTVMDGKDMASLFDEYGMKRSPLATRGLFDLYNDYAPSPQHPPIVYRK